MPHTTDFATPSNWSAAFDGFIQLLQLATAAASAKILQDPDARSVIQRGFVVPYAVDAELRQRSLERFSDRINLIATEYGELRSCFQSLDRQLRFNQVEVHRLRWEDGRKLNLAYDCVEIDRIRQLVAQHLSQCAILHAQALCAVTTYLENINTAFVCPPQNCGPVITPFGSPPNPDQSDEPEHEPHDGAEQTGRSRRSTRSATT
jgi:hypothetical protein